MTAIEVDFEVFKELTVRRPTEDTTYNDVLRDLLGLNPAPKQNTANGKGWTIKDATFPIGTKLQAIYKGKIYSGEVVDGGMVVNGQKYTTPSAAAHAITGNNVNGWRFWQYQKPKEQGWRMLDSSLKQTATKAP